MSADRLRREREPRQSPIWFGEAQAVSEGVVRVAIYLRSARRQELAGLSFAIGVIGVGGGDERPEFVAGELGTPSLVDSGVPGALALAWLDGLKIGGGNILVGYVQIPANSAGSLRLFGVDYATQ